MPALRIVMLFLCAVGFYASVFMLRKSMLWRRGRLDESSVVETPRAEVGGVPNSLVGCAYYIALAIAAALAPPRSVFALAALAAAALAAASSLYLAYSLLFVTRRSCVYCWSAHAANWLLLAATCCLALCTWV